MHADGMLKMQEIYSQKSLNAIKIKKPFSKNGVKVNFFGCTTGDFLCARNQLATRHKRVVRDANCVTFL